MGGAEGGYVDQSCKPLIRLRLQLSQYGKANNSDTTLWTLSEAGTREVAGSPNQRPLDFSALIFRIGKWLKSLKPLTSRWHCLTPTGLKQTIKQNPTHEGKLLRHSRWPQRPFS